MSVVEDASVVYQQLEKAWNSQDYKAVQNLLSEMKILLLNLSFLPTRSEEGIDERELLLARNTLEIGVLWSIATGNIDSFERYFTQLKCYYFDYAAHLPDSPYQFQILGLNLLNLLAQTRLAEFHTELELLPVESLENVYIKHPISLEQFLMEGSYHKIFLSKGNIPAENYAFFMDILICTIRDEIASCAEKAYRQVPVSEAGKMLMIDSLEKLHEYTSSRKWKLDSGAQYFIFDQEEMKEKLHFVRNKGLIQQSLGYARELEKIV